MRYRWTWIAALALSALAPTVAGAQSAGSQPGAQADASRQQARELADRGFSLFEAGQYDKAIEVFREAEKSFHAPTILLMLARAHDRLGRLLEASGVYQQILDEPLATSASPAFLEAQATARVELAALQKRIPRIEVVVTGAGPAAARILLDGAPVEPEQSVQKDPGSHTVVVSVPGGQAVTRAVTLQEGALERVAINLPAAPLTPKAPAPAAEEPTGPRKGSILPAMIAFGVGGLGLGLGAVTGALTLGKVDNLEQNCPNRVCNQGEEAHYNSAHTVATVSTVGFVVAGVGAAAGAVLLFVRPGGDAAPAQTGVLVGPGWFGVKGAF